MPKKKTTAGKIADQPGKYTGKTVTFPDFHGRTVSGPLESSSTASTAVYAALKVAGRVRAVFRNTPVTVK